jgi:hypothetical protein
MFVRKNRPSISSLDAQLNLDDDDMYLRKRIRDQSPIDRLDGDEESLALSDEEDIPGCPLPSTPEDNELLEAEVSRMVWKKQIHVIIDYECASEKKNVCVKIKH